LLQICQAGKSGRREYANLLLFEPFFQLLIAIPPEAGILLSEFLKFNPKEIRR